MSISGQHGRLQTAVACVQHQRSVLRLMCVCVCVCVCLCTVSTSSSKQPVRLYSKGVILGYKRSKVNQHCHTSLVKIENVNDKESTDFYLGKRIAYIYSVRAVGWFSGSVVQWFGGRLGHTAEAAAVAERETDGHTRRSTNCCALPPAILWLPSLVDGAILHPLDRLQPVGYLPHRISHECVLLICCRFVVVLSQAKRKVNKGGKLSNMRVVWGHVTRAHGANGVVKAKFRRNLPPKAMGARCRVMLYPSNV